MASAYHTIILGVGAMGAAAAAHLARRGLRVLGLEQFDIPNALGSSHGQSRLIRLAYYEHPHYVPLLRRAYALWRELEGLSGTRLLHVTGGLYLAPPGHELVEGSLRSAAEHSLPIERLTAAMVRSRFPVFTPPADWEAVLEPDAGFLLPEKAVAAHAAVALRHGAELRTREPAVGWSADEHGVAVRTARGTYTAERLIVTAGAWTGHVLPELAPRLRVTRQPIVWVWPRDPAAFALGRFPCWCAASPAGGLVYGPPMLADEPAPLGLKVAHHFPGRETSPDAVDRGVLPGDVDAMRETLAALLPAADGPVLSHRVCLYTNSPDHHFVVGRHPGHANVLVAGGFSGHGFKFAPVIGEALADLAAGGGTELPVAFLGPGRLGWIH
jgi:sarcosine oxidase